MNSLYVFVRGQVDGRSGQAGCDQGYDADGNILYKKIKPTKTGAFNFHFNKWIKVPSMPEMTTEGW